LEIAMKTMIGLSLGVLALMLPGMVPDDPPTKEKESPDQKFEKLLAEAHKAPEKADWKALRRAFAETTHYHPYDVTVSEELRKIAKAIGRGEFEPSEAALLKLLDQERSMRLDTLAMTMMLYDKSNQPEKAAKYRKLIDPIFKILFDPKAGGSFEEPIEVLFIEEEYLVTAKMRAKRRGLMSHEGHRFDVFAIEAQGDKPAHDLHFSVDLPQNSLARMFEKK
jgi:hypothetical protein